MNFFFAINQISYIRYVEYIRVPSNIHKGSFLITNRTVAADHYNALPEWAIRGLSQPKPNSLLYFMVSIKPFNNYTIKASCLDSGRGNSLRCYIVGTGNMTRRLQEFVEVQPSFTRLLIKTVEHLNKEG